MILMFIAIVIIGIPCMWYNYDKTRSSRSSTNWATDTTLDKNDDVWWQGLVHLGFSLTIIINIIYFRSFVKAKIIEIDEINITPSDFTLWVQGLPRDTDFDDLKKMFEIKSPSGAIENQIVGVSPAYMIEDYLKNNKKINQLNSRLNYIQEYKLKYGSYPVKQYCCCKKEYQTEQELELKINGLKKWKKEFELSSNLQFIQGDNAFLTFMRQTDCKKIIDQWHEGELERFSRFFLMCFHKFVYSKKTYKYKLLTIRPAPEPSDIIWENLTVNIFKRFLRRSLTVIITTIIILFSFAIVLSIKRYQFYQYNRSTDNGTRPLSDSDNMKLKTISFLLSLAIQFLNVVITAAIRYFSLFEKHQTWTSYNIAVFHKLVVSTTLNSIVVLMLVNCFNGNTYIPDTNPQIDYWFNGNFGLTSDVYSLLLVDAFGTPFFLIFAPLYFLKLWNRRKIKIGAKIVNQQEANEIWTNPEIDLAQRSARYIRTTLIVLIFSPIFPIGIPLGFISIFLQYWSDKILLLRRYSRSKNFGKGLTLTVIRWLPIILLLYNV